jgi:hypothetical protein
MKDVGFVVAFLLGGVWLVATGLHWVVSEAHISFFKAAFGTLMLIAGSIMLGESLTYFKIHLETK